uniref:Large ribosomal subunit protein uL6c n=1 Tax=Vertebrata thuyoides TaxID=2006970 RepID=A0A1Z1MB64_9FLOR|nr:ribosomal protein L6 [Vertebrata thuyoides]ARW63163.1 ribosomal protein L6 [Vertebrata thuyoides]
MSRIGKKEIIIPEDIKIIVNDSQVEVTGTKGTMYYNIPSMIEITINNKILKLHKKNISKQAQALHGLSRSIIYNMVIGISKGFQKKLIIQGIGYRAQIDNEVLIISVGYSHPVRIEPTKDININVENNTTIIVSGINKEKVGEIAAKIRSIRPPEPYKGKGIRYENEVVRRKVGKAGK